MIGYISHMAIAGIILAGGEGTRMNSHMVNKVVIPLAGKPMVRYGVELLEGMCEPIVIVVGAYSQTVKLALKGFTVRYAYQKRRFGTAHATMSGLRELDNVTPTHVIIGYGDHMMFYKKETVKKLIDAHKNSNLALSLVTVIVEEPEKLVWGHIIRNRRGEIIDSIEHKDASNKVKKGAELNPSLYCFNYPFLRKMISQVKKSPAAGEYYLTDMIKIAVVAGRRVAGVRVGFNEVGVGVNTPEQLYVAQKQLDVVYAQNG